MSPTPSEPAKEPETDNISVGPPEAQVADPHPSDADEWDEPKRARRTWSFAPGDWTGGTRLVIAVVVMGLAVLAVYSLLRIAGEQRYQSCVATAVGRTPGDDNLSRLVKTTAISHCSHSPF
jgi:hypothetical protein